MRNIYDLHLIWDLLGLDTVARMAREIAASDAAEFLNQYPAYHADPAAETRKVLAALRTEPVYRARYTSFVAAMVYGEQTEFADAMGTVTMAVQRWIGL